MKWPVLVLGVLLIAAGVFTISYDKIVYQKREKVFDVGSYEVTKDTEPKTLKLSPYLGIILIAGGVVLVYLGSRKPNRK